MTSSNRDYLEPDLFSIAASLLLYVVSEYRSIHILLILVSLHPKDLIVSSSYLSLFSGTTGGSESNSKDFSIFVAYSYLFVTCLAGLLYSIILLLAICCANYRSPGNVWTYLSIRTHAALDFVSIITMANALPFTLMCLCSSIESLFSNALRIRSELLTQSDSEHL